jgi:serine/threonine-protein kinase
MGEVYRAIDTRLRRKVALKVLRPGENESSNFDGVARLFREARAAAAFSHPNAVAIHDLGESSDGLFYIVMELITGMPLMAYVGDERISHARRLKWLAEIAHALAAAHKVGVIHRDVKPSNVMVTDDDVAKVLDFGLAKPMPKANEPESFGFKTQAGRVVGTVRYMAPEQMIGSEADGRSDQYALGMTAYELLAGKYPPGKPFEVPALLNTIVPTFPEDGALAIARMLKRIPEERFGSMEDVAGAFEDVAQSRPVRALGPVPSPKPAPAAPTPTSAIITAPERPAGSTLASVEDEVSADTVAAAVGTVSPLELAKTMLPDDPSAAGEKQSGQISTLASADAGDAVARVRKATSKVPQVVEVAKPEGPPKPSDKPHHATLLSAGPNEAVLAVRAASDGHAKPKDAAVSTEAPTPKVQEKPEAPVETIVDRKSAKRSNTLLIIITIAFLALAAFAGNYMGARSRSKD